MVSPDKYLVVLAACVTGRLTSFLKESPASASIHMVGDLASQPPLRAQSHAADGLNNLQAFREAMTEENCRGRLHVCKIYEHGCNLAWMSPGPVKYKKTLPGCEMTWAQIQAGRDIWTDEQLHKDTSAVGDGFVGDDYSGKEELARPCVLDIHW